MIMTRTEELTRVWATSKSSTIHPNTRSYYEESRYIINSSSTLQTEKLFTNKNNTARVSTQNARNKFRAMY